MLTDPIFYKTGNQTEVYRFAIDLLGAMSREEWHEFFMKHYGFMPEAPPPETLTLTKDGVSTEIKIMQFISNEALPSEFYSSPYCTPEQGTKSVMATIVSTGEEVIIPCW